MFVFTSSWNPIPETYFETALRGKPYAMTQCLKCGMTCGSKIAVEVLNLYSALFDRYNMSGSARPSGSIRWTYPSKLS